MLGGRNGRSACDSSGGAQVPFDHPVRTGMPQRTFQSAPGEGPYGLLSFNGQCSLRTALVRTNNTTVKTILYVRCSGMDQTIEHQRAQAEAVGFKIDEVVADHGVSGVTTRLVDRSQGRRLFDLLRAGDVLVVRWVDRLGRDYRDVSDSIREFMRRGVVIRTVINGITFDGATKDPMQQAVRDALIAFMAATAQAQAEATREAQRAGIAHAKAQGNSYRGRKPSYSRAQLDAMRAMLAQGDGVTIIAKATKLSRQTVYRIQNDPAAAEAVLAAWGM